jgi:iron complex outermembrane receptor protein
MKSQNQQAVVPVATVIKTLLGPLLLASPFLLSNTAGAQEQAAAPATSDSTKIEEVIVTGSMIARPAAETAEAITVLQADILKNEGITSVEQALNTLTSNIPSVNIAQSVGTFTGGGTYANLRGLGNSRTLVLLDGERLAPNAFSGNAVDLSGIPFSAIDNVQVLREGASALYGSDAIAGVINFITKKSFQGLEFQGNLLHPQKPGGGQAEADVTWGHGDLVNDGWNVMATASYTRQQELQATQRAFSAYGYYPALGVVNTNDPGTFPGSFADANGNLWQYGYPACAGNPFLTENNGDCAYRYSAATDLLPKSDVISGLVALTKQLWGNNTVKLQYLWTQTNVTDFAGPMFYLFPMSPTSPYLPKASQLTCVGGAANCSAPVDLVDPGTIFGETGPAGSSGIAVWTDPNNSRYNGNINTEQRILLTFTGHSGGWNYSGALNYSQNKNDDRNISGYPNEAILAPGGVLSDSINPFGPQSAAGQALINSSYIPGVYEVGTDTRWSVEGFVSHPLFHLTATPATLALGFTVGHEHFDNETTPYNDLVSAATGLGDSYVTGNRKTQAVYAELDVPITEQLDVDVSDRQDHYSDFGNTNNWKAGVRFQPTSWLTLRGTASTGFRAPTLANLYAPNSLAASSGGTMGQGNPDCVNPSGPLWTAQTCNTQGIGLFGGNPSLTPEKSKNYDLGIVLSPIRDMGLTVDWFKVDLTNTIGAVLGDSNTGSTSTKGFDVSLEYQQKTSIGTFHEDVEGTAITKFDLQQYTTGPILNLLGWFNENPPAYRWQHFVRIDWSSTEHNWNAGLDNRFYSSYVDEFAIADGSQRRVGNYSLWDAYTSYKPVKNLTVLFGIRNLLNTAPPFTNAQQGNFAAGYNALVADPLLRSFYINLKYDVF